MSDCKPPQNYKNAFFFNVDKDLSYFPFNKDFGPLNLAMAHRFSRELARLLRDDNYKDSRVFHWCSSEKPDKMVNGAFLMGCFMVIILQIPAVEAYRKFKDYHPMFKHYRDASKGNCEYECTLLHCLQGIEHAVQFKWYEFRNFKVKDYEFNEKVENGDLNWIIPGKFVAFMGPVDRSYPTDKKYPEQKFGHHPSKHVQIFQEIGVDRVIRLNEPRYDRQVFVTNGIAHNDLEFTDGSTPPDDIVSKFF